MSDLTRYSLIETKMKREFLLLQGTGCRWKKCSFCDYHTDVCADPYTINKQVIGLVTGKFGVLDIINSGSVCELDKKTMKLIKETAADKKIHTLWFEAHYMYKNKLKVIADYFAPLSVKFRCGIETFNPDLRNKWDKGIDESVSAEDVAEYFSGVCLLCCVKGQSKETIVKDIETAKKYFEYFSVNLFCNNTTYERRDEELVKWFYKTIYPEIKNDDRIEVLNDNTDLGVG